jgi:hypothetical protein
MSRAIKSLFGIRFDDNDKNIFNNLRKIGAQKIIKLQTENELKSMQQYILKSCKNYKDIIDGIIENKKGREEHLFAIISYTEGTNYGTGYHDNFSRTKKIVVYIKFHEKSCSIYDISHTYFVSPSSISPSVSIMNQYNLGPDNARIPVNVNIAIFSVDSIIASQSSRQSRASQSPRQSRASQSPRQSRASQSPRQSRASQSPERLSLSRTSVTGVTGGKKVSIHARKEILGKTRCVYKKAGSRKEYIKYKGQLIAVKKYKELMKKAKAKAKSIKK